MTTLPRRQTSAMSARSKSKRWPSAELRRAGVLQDVEALGHRLHHAVLDAVVDHLDEMAGAARPGMEVALLGAGVAALAARRSPGCRRARARAPGRSGRAAAPPPSRRRSSGSSRARAPTPRRSCRHRGSAGFFGRARAARRTSSFQNELPPSMTVSPGESKRLSASTAPSVASPEGSMTQTARGASSAATREARPSAAVAPSPASARPGAGSRSCTTQSCPARSSRRTMFPPIRPRPTTPSCMGTLVSARPGAVSRATNANRAGGVNRRRAEGRSVPQANRLFLA